MKTRRILILGYFGRTTNKRDGQTIKTRQYLELLEKNLGGSARIDTFDTQVLHFRPWQVITLLWKVVRSKTVVYMPAQNNLSHFFGTLFVLSRIFDIDIVYPLIGGWLPDFLEKNRKFVGKLSKIKGIFPENRTITELLVKKYALQNVHTLSNFRFVEYEPDVPSSNKDMFRIVFMSRIVKAKGIETVFKIAGYFSDPEVREKYPVSIDFYGERFEESDDYFEQMLARFDNVCYKGVLEPKEITRTLSAYDVLILPTRYPGEGVSGAIIDAYMAGLPVLVSDWMYVKDSVFHGKTGYIVALDEHEVENYVGHIKYLFSHQEELDKMKKEAYLHSKEHGETVAWAILRPFLA